MGADDQRLQGALDDLQGYLADSIAPLLVADAFETLLDYPPALTAEQLRVWSFFQYQGRGGATLISDILFHAIKKIQQLEVHDLVPRDRFEGFLGGVAIALLEVCPDAERERLAGLLRHLRDSIGGATALVDRLHRPGGQSPMPHGGPPMQHHQPMHQHQPMQQAPMSQMTAQGAPGTGSVFASPIAGSAAAMNQTSTGTERPSAESAAPTAAEIRDLRRFTLALERAVAGMSAGAGAGASSNEAYSQQMLVLATSGAKDDADLAARLAKLREAGVTTPGNSSILRSLIGAVPDFAVAIPGAVKVPASGSIEAVRKAVKLGGDRWTDLLKTSAEQWNAGAFGRAVQLIDLAERMLKDGEVDTRAAEIARGNAHEAFETTKLLQAVADRKNWPLIRRLLEFHPAWSVRELLDSLVFQPDTKKRRLLIALVEIWGAEARPLVLERLETSIAEASRDANAWWYQRNLVYLLHRIPRLDDQDLRQEVELIAPFSGLMHPPSFQRETLQLLALLPGYAGVPTMVQRLGECEKALEAQAPVHPVEELWKIQNSIATSLIRCGSLSARRVVLDHALARNPRNGDTLGRLRELGRIDLSDDREAVKRLLDVLRELAPRKVFGIVVSRNDEAIASVALALVSTTAPQVRQVLAELSAQYPELHLDRPLAPAVSDAHHDAHPELGPPEPIESAEGDTEKFAVEATAAPGRGSLSGDLELFGLAGLLQTFQQSETTGRLVLREPKGQPFAELALHRGQLVECRTGKLTGNVAFFQLLEVPSGGTFEFTRLEPSATTPPTAREILGLLLEGMRRYDELQRLRVVVPDQLVLRAGGTRPTAPQEETDGDFIRQVWEKVRPGTMRVVECESTLPADTYRVRSLLAHWLEGGALAAA